MSYIENMYDYANEEIPKKAAEWWANQLGQADAGHDAIWATSRESIEASDLNVTEKKRQQFQSILELLILVSKPTEISVGREPDKILALALDKASLHIFASLPIGLATSIDWSAGSISTRCGRDREWICVQNSRI